MTSQALLAAALLLCLFAVRVMSVAGPIWGMLVLACAAVVFLVKTHVEAIRFRNAELSRFAKQIENIYICHENANERDETIAMRAAYAEQMLAESGNQIHKRLPVKVHKIYFRAGEFVNESWTDYELRRDAFIAEDKRKRHIMLEKLDPRWYEKYVLNQIMP